MNDSLILTAQTDSTSSDPAIQKDSQGKHLQSPLASVFQSPIQLKHLIDNVPGVIYQFLLEPDGRKSFPYMSQGVRELYGVEPEQAQQNVELLFNFVHPEDFPQVEQSIAESAQTLQRWQCEWRVILPSGEQKWLKGTSQPEKQPNGAILWSGYITDITQRKQAEAILKQQQSQIKSILDNVPHIAWLKDQESQYIAVNEPFAQACGVSSQQIAGQTDYDLWPLELAEAYRQDDSQVMQSRQRQQIEEKLVNSTGEVYWVETCKTPIYDEKNQVIGTAGISQDITERKNLELKLKKQTKTLKKTLKQLKKTQVQIIQTEKLSSLGDIVGGIAHEINNPVNFISANLTHAEEYVKNLLDLIHIYQKSYPQFNEEIQGFTEEIELDYIEEDFSQLLQSMKVGSKRIQQIVLSLRNFSRLDEAEVKDVDLHQGIESTLLILNNRLQRLQGDKIEVIKEYDKLPLVQCYPGQINQVFMNLLDNAIDALEKRTEGKQIRIKTALINSDWVAIHITDNGAGIPSNIQGKIFDPFFTTKPVGQGTGLGLSSCYQIITEVHKGTIQCHSTVGTGTEFIIKLPIILRGTGYKE